MNCININTHTTRYLHFYFSALEDRGFIFESRGELEIKGKGVMRTHFLLSSSSKLPPLSFSSQKASIPSSCSLPSSIGHEQKLLQIDVHENNSVSSVHGRRSKSSHGSSRFGSRSSKSTLCQIV